MKVIDWFVAIAGISLMIAAVTPEEHLPPRQQGWVLVKLCDSSGHQVGERIYNTAEIHWAEPTSNPNIVRAQFEDEIRYICGTWDSIKKLTRVER